MEVTGKIKKIDETKTFGNNGFRKREVVVTTDEQYPQFLLIEFIQDKCDLLDNYNVGEDVKISINLRGREWINPEGEAKYFNAIQGFGQGTNLVHFDQDGVGHTHVDPFLQAFGICYKKVIAH